MDCTPIRTRATILCAALFAPGCVIVSDDGGTASDSAGDTGTGGPGSTTAPTTSTATSATTSPETTGPSDDDGTTGGFPEDCSENLVGDPGFEGGTPNDAWDEHSDVFGTPICDTSCTEDTGAAPFRGDWFVWFGGLEDGQSDVAWVAQDLEIAPSSAHLRFRLAISGHEPNGDNVMVVDIDEDVVFMVTDLDQASYDGYHVVDVDVSAFADGATHQLRFMAEFSGTVLANFFVDEVELVSCDDVETTGADSTGTGTAESSTGAADETGADETTGGEDTGTTTGGTTGSGD